MKRLFSPLSLLVLSLLASFLPAPADAQSSTWDSNTIRWDAPTTCQTGEPISACVVTAYRIERSATPGGAYATVGTVGAVTTFVHNGAAAGQNCYRVIAIAANGPALPSSPPACKTNTRPAGPPNPATNVTVVETTVYDVRPNESTFAFERGRAVGTVKLGAACDETRTTGQDFYALERPSRATLNRTPRSAALVAKCASAS